MPSSDYTSDEELQQLIIEAMIREQQEKQYAEERPYLYAPTPQPPPERLAEEITPEDRRVIVIDI